MKDDAGVVQFWTLSLDGGQPRQVTRYATDISSAFTWTPNGRYVAHVMDESVFLTEVATGTGTRLTPKSPAAAAPLPQACGGLARRTTRHVPPAGVGRRTSLQPDLRRRSSFAMSLRTTIARVWVLPTPTVSANPIRSLANEFVAVDESPDPKNVGLYTPSILALPGGRLVAGYERGIARWWTSMVMISRSCRAVVMPAPKARMILSRCTARKGFGSWFIKV